MNQTDFNKQWEEDHPLPDDPSLIKQSQYTRPLTRAQKQVLLENQRMDSQVDQEIADRNKLDAQASRNAYAWKLRAMKQRGRRY